MAKLKRNMGRPERNEMSQTFELRSGFRAGLAACALVLAGGPMVEAAVSILLDQVEKRVIKRRAAVIPAALVVRTLRDGQPLRAYEGPAPAPYLSRQAAEWIVAHGIETLVLDLPSADRADDGGKLTAHRVFFGLPPGSRDARAASRPHASITELAWVPAGIADGYYLLDLQIPAFVTDAAPSRPLLFPVQPA